MSRLELRQGRAYLGNPWLLTFSQVRLLVLLADYSRKEIALQLGLSERNVHMQVSRLLPYFDADCALRAAVQFDRWWQNWQREHKEDGHAEAARACLGL